MHHVQQLYTHIIDEVIKQVRQDYTEEGYDEAVLQTLKNRWWDKVVRANVFPDSDEPTTMPTSHDYSLLMRKRHQESMNSGMMTSAPAPGQPYLQGLQQVSNNIGPIRPGAVPMNPHLTQAARIAAQSLPQEHRPFENFVVSQQQHLSQNAAMFLPGGQNINLATGKKTYILPKNNQLDGAPGGDSSEFDESSDSDDSDLVSTSVRSANNSSAAPTPANPADQARSSSLKRKTPGDPSSKSSSPRKRGRPRKHESSVSFALGNEAENSISEDDEEDGADDIEVDDDDENLLLMNSVGKSGVEDELDEASDEGEGEDDKPLNSEDDVTDEEKDDLFDTDNVMVCQYDKVNHIRNKWRFTLRDGIMHIRGKDYVFTRSTGDAEW